MTVGNIRRLEQQFLENDGKLSAAEASELIDSAEDWLGVSADERAELEAVLERDADRLEPGAKRALLRFLRPEREAEGRPAPPVRVVTGADPADFADDQVFFGADGTVRGETQVAAYTRGYASIQEGPLRQAHGSPAPVSSVLTAEENAAARARTPGRGLDAAAAALGARVDGFEKLAGSKDFYDPTADFWWGKCHAWAWAALDQTINGLVDVEGPQGQKGVWIAGSWVSRADLGNWMMAVADTISLADGQSLFRSGLSATDLVKGTTQFLTERGGGVVADVFNDAKKGRKEVWNQPFVAADFTARSLRGPAAEGLLAQARADGVGRGAQVKQLTIVGTFAIEQGDGHEGAPGTSSKTWQVYAVADAGGKLLTAYMADDAKLAGLAGLPTRVTDDVPEYFWKPKLGAIGDVLAGRRNPVVENDAHAAEFKFFLQAVLSRGVPGQKRAAFEAKFQALPDGPIDPPTAAALSREFHGVAYAYTPGQWRRIFESRGLERYHTF